MISKEEKKADEIYPFLTILFLPVAERVKVLVFVLKLAITTT